MGIAKKGRANNVSNDQSTRTFHPMRHHTGATPTAEKSLSLETLPPLPCKDLPQWLLSALRPAHIAADCVADHKPPDRSDGNRRIGISVFRSIPAIEAPMDDEMVR
jgi:hypothetical protein